MKKIIFFLFLFFWGINYTNAGINTSITLTGTSVADTTGVSNAGKLVFPSTGSGVIINASALDTNASANISISGNFWAENTSSSSDPSLGWITFDTGLSSKVVLNNNGNNTFTFSGFAWSNAAGWIYFSPTPLDSTDNNTKVVYDRNSEKVNGCAWSENLGWICLDNFFLDTTPINLTDSSWNSFFATSITNNQKSLTITSTNLPDVSSLKITNWNNTSYIGITNLNSIIVDLRKAKDYNIVVTDKSGNTSDKDLTVVAGVPTTTLDSNNIGGGATASTYNSDFSTNKVANGDYKHNISFTLRDKYGNPVIPVAGIKDVKIYVEFSNNVDKNQINNYNFGDAITYSSSIFSLNNSTNNGTGTSSNGDYNIDISSLAPTSAGYSETNPDNDISLNQLIVNVTGVGANSGDLYTGIYGQKLKFTPSVYVSTISNDLSWNIPRDVRTYFTGTITLNNPKNVSSIKVQHILDTMSGSSYRNNFISFQDILKNNGFTTCFGHNKPGLDNLSYSYYTTGTECNLIDNGSTNIKKSYEGPYNSSTNLPDSFEATPKVVLAGIPSFDVKYSSNISYNVGLSTISYPSLTDTKSSKLKNNTVKVTGIVNQNNSNFSVIGNDTTNYIGTIDKNTVFTNIRKNVVPYQRIGTGSKNVYYTTSDYIVPSTWPSGIDTIIVDGADVIISSDITKISGQVKSIIALKGSNTNKGNIWITKDVQKIYATLVSDRSVLSGDGTNSYGENIAKDQLFIKGSVLSYNTIGGSSLATPKCPFYVTVTCNSNEAKKYDFNNFRYFINGVGVSVSGLPTTAGYADAPMIIEYDSDLQNNTPKIFLVN